MKEKRGRPEHIPTDALRAQVAEMTAFGATQDSIALMLKMSLPTLHKHYRHELDVGKESAIQKVAGNLFRIATGESKAAVTAACFYLKTQGGWRETDRNGGEQQVIVNINDGVTHNVQRVPADHRNNTDKPTA